MPPTSMAAARPKAVANECDLPTRYPVTTGAAIAGMFPAKFIMPATRAVLPGGAIKPGIDHTTGAVAANPDNAIEIQMIEPIKLEVCAAPAIASPDTIPSTRTDCLTRVGLSP